MDAIDRQIRQYLYGSAQRLDTVHTSNISKSKADIETEGLMASLKQHIEESRRAGPAQLLSGGIPPIRIPRI